MSLSTVATNKQTNKQPQKSTKLKLQIQSSGARLLPLIPCTFIGLSAGKTCPNTLVASCWLFKVKELKEGLKYENISEVAWDSLF